MDKLLSLINIRKSYGSTTVLSNISFDIMKKNIVAILGPSGSGKSTILKIISGVLKPNGGQIFYMGKNLLEMPIHQRNFGVVFQGYSLFPHLSVFDNIAFPLTTSQHKMKDDKIKEKVNNLMKLLSIDGLEKRKPNEISGGQQQRVALARAIIFNPNLLLLDEPLAALDTKLKNEFLKEIERIYNEFDISIIYITHDQKEAMQIANEIIIINDGKILQKDVPTKIYNNPVNEFVLNFFGEANSLFLKQNFNLTSDLMEYLVCDNTKNVIKVFIRPEHIFLSEKKPEKKYFFIKGKLKDTKYLGNKWSYCFKIGDCSEWIVYNKSKYKINVEDSVFLYWGKNNLLNF